MKAQAQKSYKNLLMWEASNDLIMSVYNLSNEFPRSEMYGLTSQLRRAALSVVLNIIEGYARRTEGDYRRFLAISLGSLAETEYLLELTHKLGYLSVKNYNTLESKREYYGKLLWSYRQKLIE